MQEVESFKTVGKAARDVLAKMQEAPREVAGFFAGMHAVEVEPGVTIYGSPDLLRAHQKLHTLREENRVLSAKRDNEVMNEAVVMGETILPIGAEIILSNMPRDRSVAKIIDYSAGYKDRPMYRVHLRDKDGNYPEGKEIRPGENELHVYARHMVDFGLTIIQGKLNDR